MNKAQRLYRFMWLSRPLVQRIEDMVRDQLEGTGLTVRMRAVMEVLEAQGALSVPDIARELHIQRQYVQVMVNEVISEGFVEKRPNPKHRSSPLITLTPSGETLIRAVLETERGETRRLAETFSDDEVEAALRVAERLCDEIARNKR